MAERGPWRHARRLALAIMLAEAAQAQAPLAGDAFAGIPNLTIEYYDVSGAGAQAIRRSLDAQRTPDANDGTLVDARARWHIRWTWIGREDGRRGCVVDLAIVHYTAELRLPRLTDEDQVPAPVRARWHSYIAALERHESGHLRYALEHIGDVQAALQSATCARADDLASEAIRAIKQHDVDYDRETRHGIAQGAVFP
jgi:predicted secreted Zn-dependent protease